MADDYTPSEIALIVAAVFVGVIAIGLIFYFMLRDPPSVVVERVVVTPYKPEVPDTDDAYWLENFPIPSTQYEEFPDGRVVKVTIISDQRVLREEIRPTGLKRKLEYGSR